MTMIRQSAISAGHPLNTVLMLGGNDHLSRMGTHQLIFQPLALTQTEWLAIGGTVLMSIVLVLLAAFVWSTGHYTKTEVRQIKING